MRELCQNLLKIQSRVFQTRGTDARMPLQNRVLPTGDIVAIPARGTFTGNRGILHRDDRTLGTSRWTHHAWICCTLDWQGRKRQVMTGRNWTELFFLDEAVALAAGHRPCAYCRRADYTRFVDCWEAATGARPKAPDMDRALHATRIIKGTRRQRTDHAHPNDLPAGTFIFHDDQSHIITPDGLRPYTPDGYAGPVATPDHPVTVLTPSPIRKILQSGYAPALHLSARQTSP
jgi:hypothetical protein